MKLDQVLPPAIAKEGWFELYEGDRGKHEYVVCISLPLRSTLNWGVFFQSREHFGGFLSFFFSLFSNLQIGFFFL